MKIDSFTKLYCLIGNPITKSLSPNIHNYVFEKENINAVYLAFNINKKELESVIDSFKVIDVKGFNVTIPYKQEIIEYLDELSYEAKVIGAVNTVKNEKGKLIGYNTDGLGFLKTLEERNIKLKDKNVLILGAGGAAQSISLTAASLNPNSITILNRTVTKGIQLVNKIKSKFSKLECYYGSLYDKNIDFKKFDILINCTSIGMYPNDNSVPIDLHKFNEKLIVYEIVYKPLETKLIQNAKKLGMKTITGIDMLIYQALLSDEIWLDKKLEIGKLKEEIKEGFYKHL